MHATLSKAIPYRNGFGDGNHRTLSHVTRNHPTISSFISFGTERSIIKIKTARTHKSVVPFNTINPAINKSLFPPSVNPCVPAQPE